MTAEEARRLAQDLLLTAAESMLEVTKLAEEHKLDGLHFIDMTFHVYRPGYDGELRELDPPAWFDNEYWQSSTAGCEVYLKEPEDDE